MLRAFSPCYTLRQVAKRELDGARFQCPADNGTPATHRETLQQSPSAGYRRLCTGFSERNGGARHAEQLGSGRCPGTVTLIWLQELQPTPAQSRHQCCLSQWPQCAARERLEIAPYA
jgi:hypothetical protein